MRIHLKDRLFFTRTRTAAYHGWPLLLLVLLMLIHGAGQAQTPADSAVEVDEVTAPIQVLEGRVSTGDLHIYRIDGLKKGEKLYVHAKLTSGHLDPLVALLKPDTRLELLTKSSMDDQIKTLSRDHDPIVVTRQLLDRYALAWNDDYEGHYHAALSVEIPEDGDYRLAVGSSLVRDSAGTYRLTVGIDEPDVLSGEVESRGPAFIFAAMETGALERGIVLVTDELKPDQAGRFYHLADLAADQTLYAYAEAVSGDLKPVLTLYDYSDKPLAYANFAATSSRAMLHYQLPQKAEQYRLRISGEDPAGKASAGSFRLLIGLNAPEVLQGQGEPTGQEILQEPIPVDFGVKLQQLTGVNQKEEHFGVVATVVMQWKDRRLAFDPEKVRERFKIFTGDAFSSEMNRRGLPWPRYTIVNQQGRLMVQNRVVVVRPDGEVIYFERFSTALQAPDFDFRNFPFDKQNFYIRFDLLGPLWMYQLREIKDYSEIGGKLGEEEWVIIDFDTSISAGKILKSPVSRFNFEFQAKRHLAYYFFRIILPLIIIISVSWMLFFLKDYAKRVDAAGANLLLFIAFNFAISRDLPRLGYLTFLDTLLISAFLVTAVVLIMSVYLRRQDMNGREDFVARVDRYIIISYPLAYALTIATVTILF